MAGSKKDGDYVSWFFQLQFQNLWFFYRWISRKVMLEFKIAMKNPAFWSIICPSQPTLKFFRSWIEEITDRFFKLEGLQWFLVNITYHERLKSFSEHNSIKNIQFRLQTFSFNLSSVTWAQKVRLVWIYKRNGLEGQISNADYGFWSKMLLKLLYFVKSSLF